MVDTALNLYGSAMGFDDVFDDGQAQPSSSQFSGTGLVHPVESFKDAIQMFLGNADAGILDRDFYEISVEFGVRSVGFADL